MTNSNFKYGWNYINLANMDTELQSNSSDTSEIRFDLNKKTIFKE